MVNGPNVDRPPVAQVAGLPQVDAGPPELRGPQHVGCALADPHRDAVGQVGHQPPMVGVAVAQQHRQRQRADRRAGPTAGGSGIRSPGAAVSGRPRSSRTVASPRRTSTQLPPISAAPRWMRTCIPSARSSATGALWSLAFMEPPSMSTGAGRSPRFVPGHSDRLAPPSDSSPASASGRTADDVARPSTHASSAVRRNRRKSTVASHSDDGSPASAICAHRVHRPRRRHDTVGPCL